MVVNTVLKWKFLKKISILPKGLDSQGILKGSQVYSQVIRGAS